MNLLIGCDYAWQREEFVRILGFPPAVITLVGDRLVYEYDTLSISMLDRVDQIAIICQHFPTIKHVALLGNKCETTEPTHFHIRDAQELEDLLGYPLEVEIKHKLNSRIINASQAISLPKSVKPEPTWRKRLRPTKEGSDCVACLSAQATIAMVPCGHQCLCDTCAETIMDGDRTKKCPLCRELLETIIRPIRIE